MPETTPAEIVITRCLACGVANSVENTHCRKCGAELKQGVKTLVPGRVLWGVIGFIALVTGLVAISLLSEPLGRAIAGGMTIVAIALLVVGTFWLLTTALREGIRWAILCLILPGIGSLSFLFARPGSAARPFTLQIAGVIFLIVFTVRPAILAAKAPNQAFMEAMADGNTSEACSWLARQTRAKLCPDELQEFRNYRSGLLVNGYYDMRTASYYINWSASEGTRVDYSAYLSYVGRDDGAYRSTLVKEGDAWRILYFEVFERVE